MTPNDQIQMMQRCIEEIRMLRAQIDHLKPKAHAYDTMTAILGLLPQPAQGYGEDLVWRLEKQIKELSPINTAEVS